MTATHQPPMPPPAPPTSSMPPPAAPAAKKKKRWPWVVGVLVVLVGIGAAMGSGDKDAADTAAPATKETPAAEADASTADVEQVADETPVEEPAADSGISKGLGSKDASADVTEVQIIRDDDEFMPIDEVSVKVTNNSEKRSDYFIDVSIESADGSMKIDSTTIYVENLEPGQSTVQTGMLLEDLPDDAVPSVKSIQRTASN